MLHLSTTWERRLNIHRSVADVIWPCTCNIYYSVLIQLMLWYINKISSVPLAITCCLHDVVLVSKTTSLKGAMHVASIRSTVVNKVTIKPWHQLMSVPCDSFSTLTTIGEWQRGIYHEKTGPLNSKGLLLKHAAKVGSGRKATDPGSHGNMVAKVSNQSLHNHKPLVSKTLEYFQLKSNRLYQTYNNGK